MSDYLLLDWSMMTLSLFNTILLFWLGLTVLLNSDKRRAGIWLASAGLLLGGTFFVSHTALLGSNLFQFVWWGFLFWWIIGMIAAITLPFAWYASMLWYVGFWDSPDSRLRHRHLRWLWLIGLMLIAGFFALVVTTILLNSWIEWLQPIRTFLRWSIAGIPLLSVSYSCYVVLCIGLSLDALRRPGPTGREMGGLARQRARPWLAGAAFALLTVSLLIAGILTWFAQNIRQQTFFTFFPQIMPRLAWLDLLIAGIIAISVLFLGQAIVSYELFTGRALPRRGLARHWRRAIIMADGFSLLMAGNITLGIRPIYAQILSALLLTLFFALFSWRAYAERERYVSNLRPFLTSQRLYDSLLTPTAPPEVDMLAPFQTLCGNLLNAQLAYLIPTGPLAPLIEAPLCYPENVEKVPAITDLIPQFTAPQTNYLALNSKAYGGAIWGVPLWSERGLIGIFLLGSKRDGGLYSQEEIELARVSGERLIDTQASAEMGRRLIALQRERLSINQVADQRTRRILHDEILPTIHATMISLGGNKGQKQAVDSLAEVHRQISDLLREMPQAIHPDIARLGLLRAIERAIEGEYAHAFDEIEWHSSPEAVAMTRSLSPLSAEVLFYATREVIRNSAQHGRPTNGSRPFQLQGKVHTTNGLQIEITDNGTGITSMRGDNSGAGQGLAIHTAMMAVIGGVLSVESVPNEYTRVTLSLS